MFLDTSIIIDIFRSQENSKPFKRIYVLIKDEKLFFSVIQISEISDWCLKNDINPTERVSSLKRIVNIVPLNENMCCEGSTPYTVQI